MTDAAALILKHGDKHQISLFQSVSGDFREIHRT